ncbi:MAG: HipA N-terminal domain-containing protein, partial [Clostridium butyricum]|nr:HipA N-terminal domain-containing protein [Clostridium butyricum]
MENNKKEHIYVIWKDPESRKRFKIGNLIRNNKYIFEYDLKETYQAMKYGFEPFVAFPDINEVYSHNDLFLTFLCRLPDRRRADINEILKNYGMDKFDAFELLLRSGGRLPTDTLEFIKPIFIEES